MSESFLETTDYMAKMQLALAQIAGYPLGLNGDDRLRHARWYLEDLSIKGKSHPIADRLVPDLMEQIGYFIAHPTASNYLEVSKKMVGYQKEWEQACSIGEVENES